MIAIMDLTYSGSRMIYDKSAEQFYSIHSESEHEEGKETDG